MSADHRKPVVAFIVLAFLAAAVVGIQRAEAGSGRFLASLLGATGHVDGTLRHAGRSAADEDDLLAIPRRLFAGVEQQVESGREPPALVPHPGNRRARGEGPAKRGPAGQAAKHKGRHEGPAANGARSSARHATAPAPRPGSAKAAREHATAAGRAAQRPHRKGRGSRDHTRTLLRGGPRGENR